MTTVTSKPIGVLIVAWASIAVGASEIIGSLALWAHTGKLFPSLVLLVFGVISLGLGIALRSFQSWVLYLMLGYLLLVALTGFLSGHFLGALLATLLIVYLCTPKVRDAFSSSDQESLTILDHGHAQSDDPAPADSVPPALVSKAVARNNEPRPLVAKTLRLLYWPAALILVILIALGTKIIFFEQHDRAYSIESASVLLFLLTLCSGLTFLRFSTRKIGGGILLGHCALLVLGLFGSAYSTFFPNPSRGARSAKASNLSQMGAAPSGTASSDQSDPDRQFWEYRMSKCRPLVDDDGELQHQERMLLIIEDGLVKWYNQRGPDSARQKALSELSTIAEAETSATALRKKFSSQTFDDVRPEWFADVLRKYCVNRAKHAEITEGRARSLSDYGRTGDAKVLVGLNDINKSLVKGAKSDAEFQNLFAKICFSPPEKLEKSSK